jgi:hypothetical protein
VIDRNPNHIHSEAQTPRDQQTRNIPDYIFEEHQEKSQAWLSTANRHCHSISSFSLIERVYLNFLIYHSLKPLDPTILVQVAAQNSLKDRLQTVLTDYEHRIFKKPLPQTHHAYHPQEDEDFGGERQAKQPHLPHNPRESLKVVPLPVEVEGQDA